VLAEAMALADAEGIEALSMRSLAKAVGVEAMSLYHHVANKDDLLDGMVDAVFAEVDQPVVGEAWRPQLRTRCTSLRAVLLRHPWAVGRLDSRRSPGLATLSHHDAVIGCLRADGFSVPATARAFATLDAFVYGFVLQEVSLPLQEGEAVADIAEEILGSIDPTAFPALMELAIEHVQQPGYAFGEEFEPGLDLVLDGIADLRSPAR
jgi:AcrR family transcriptional regulator